MLQQIIFTFSSYPAAFILLASVLGLCIGSFLNVVIYRLPKMMMIAWKKDFVESFPDSGVKLTEQETLPFNLAKPGSTCPKCGHNIRAWENVPVISWLFLGGKCSQCKTAISKRYPSIELLTGICSGFVAWQFGMSWLTLGILMFTWILIALIFIDFDEQLLPDHLTLPLLWLGLLINLNGTIVPLETAVIGAVAGYLALWSVYWAFKILTGKEGMGFGDFKLLAALGAWLGWQQLPVIVILSSGVGAILGIVLILFKGRDHSVPMPFGPFLAIAGWLALFRGEQIIEWYLHSFVGI